MSYHIMPLNKILHWHLTQVLPDVTYICFILSFLYLDFFVPFLETGSHYVVTAGLKFMISCCTLGMLGLQMCAIMPGSISLLKPHWLSSDLSGLLSSFQFQDIEMCYGLVWNTSLFTWPMIIHSSELSLSDNLLGQLSIIPKVGHDLQLCTPIN
jgi:hypothetical protein